MDMNALRLQEPAIDPSGIFTPSRDTASDGGFGRPYSMTGSDDTEEDEDEDDEEDDDGEGEGEGEDEGEVQ